jgi:hypothetical protein
MITQKTLDEWIARGVSSQTIDTVMSHEHTGIVDAIVAADGVTRLAKQIGVTHQAVQQWLKAGYVPLARVTEIEALYGIARERLINPKYTRALSAPRFDNSDGA